MSSESESSGAEGFRRGLSLHTLRPYSLWISVRPPRTLWTVELWPGRGIRATVPGLGWLRARQNSKQQPPTPKPVQRSCTHSSACVHLRFSPLPLRLRQPPPTTLPCTLPCWATAATPRSEEHTSELQ